MAVENRGPQVQATAILFLTLSWLFIVMRCYVRIVMIKQFGTDDWLAVAALVLFTLYCTFVLKGVQYGTGQHLSNLPAANVPIALKWWWCCELAYVSSTAILKISIGVFLARICIHKAQRIAIWVVVAGMSAFSVFYFFIIVFQCRPVIWFWTQYTGVGSGSCVNASVIADSTYAHSAVSAVCDFTLGTLPLFLVWNLNMNPRTKVSVAFILALGAVGSVATIVRIPYINQLTETSDFLYTTTDVAIWSTVEPGIGITAAAMATLRPLFRTFLSRSKLLGSTSNKYAKYGGPSQAWPQSSRKGYLKSGSGPDNSAAVELGLRSDIGKHSGVTTVIKSQHDKKSLEDIRSPRKLEKPHGSRVGGDQMSQWNNSESRLKDDDSSEDAVHMGWEVRKTTEVTTQEDTASDIGSKPAKMWS